MFYLLFPVIGVLLGLAIRNSMNAGKNNLPSEYVFNCSKYLLTEAIKNAADYLDYKIERNDPISGKIRLGVGASLASFGEWIDIHLIEISPNKTQIIITCSAKRGRESFGKNRKNITKLLDAISESLS